MLALAIAAPAGAAANSSMAIQPDGRILVATEAWPGFGSLVRLGPNGGLDRSFGDRGFLVDRRMPPLRAVAIQPDGRILGGAPPGFQLSRYLADGRVDLSFGGGSVAGTLDPNDSRFGEGPQAILTQPDGTIVVGGSRLLSKYTTPQAIVQRYDSSGNFLETVGLVPQGGTEPPISESRLKGLVPGANGSLIMAGSAFGASKGGVLLARLMPGSGASYDSSFGGGEGLIRPSSLPENGVANTIAQDADRLIIAGGANYTLLLARFDQEGKLDPSFGNGGVVSPPIEGTSGGPGGSTANAVAVQGDGKIVVAGMTSKWGDWMRNSKTIDGYSCGDICEEPLIARFTPDGQLDSSFGQGGVIRLTGSAATLGERVPGHADTVAVLPGGKILVKGVTRILGLPGLEVPFLARLNADGTFDSRFVGMGMTILRPACTGKDLAKLRRGGCIASARARFRASGLASGRPSVSLRVKPSLPWARIATVRLQLPPTLKATAALAEKTRVLAIGGKRGSAAPEGGPKRYLEAEPQEPKPGRIAFNDLGEPRMLDVRLGPGALRMAASLPLEEQVFRITVRFVHAGSRAGRQALVFRTTG